LPLKTILCSCLSYTAEKIFAGHIFILFIVECFENFFY